MVDLAKDITQKIRDASRPKIGPIRRGAAEVARAIHPGLGVDWDRKPLPLEFLKHSYVLVRDEDTPISPRDFYRTNAGIVREKLFFLDGNFADTADNVASVGANVRYSTRVLLYKTSNVVMTLSVAMPVKMYISYTPLGQDEVPVLYSIRDDGGNAYIDFFGGNVAMENVPSGWVQIDMYLYAPEGFSYFYDNAGVLARVINASKASVSSLPNPPVWNNYCTAVTTSEVLANATSVPATITSATFPTWGIVKLDDEPISFAYHNAQGLQLVRDLNEDHASGAPIVGGAIWPEVSAGVPGQNLVDFKLSWNLPTQDADGFPLKDAVTINLFEVVYEPIDEIFDIGDSYVMTAGDVSAEVFAGDRLRIDFGDTVYYECAVSGVAVVGSQTKVTFSTPIKQWVKTHYEAILEGSLSRPRRAKIAEFRDNTTTETIRNIPRVGSKSYCLSASVPDAGESAYSDVLSNYTFPYCAPPDPTPYVQLIGGSSMITIELLKAYFDTHPYAYITSIKLSVLSTGSSTRKDDIPNEVQIYSGVGEPFRRMTGALLEPDQNVADIYFHFYLTMTSGAGFMNRFWLGCTQLGANVVAPDPPVLSNANFIVNFDDLDDEPFAEEALQSVASVLSAATDPRQKISPVVVVGVEKPAQSGLSVEIACRPAVYWGVIDSVDPIEERVYMSDIINEEGETEFLVDLRGLALIDSSGKIFTIRENSTKRVGYFLGADAVDPATGEFGIIKMPTTLEDEGKYVPPVVDVQV